MKPWILSLSIFAVFTTLLFAESREWTQASTGKKLEGEFIKMQDEKTAVIKMRGVDRPVPLSMLSAEDQKWIAEKIAPPAPEPAAGGKMEEKKGSASKKGSTPQTTPTPAGKLPPGPISVTLSEVNICCRDAEERAEKSKENEKLKFTDIAGVTIEPNKSEGTIKVSAASGKDAMTALSGLMQAGFYGVSDHGMVKIADLNKGDLEANTMSVRDVPVCCSKCLSTIKKALKEVDGVEDHTAKSGGNGFNVTGEGFKPKDVMNALRAQGIGGRYQ